MIDQLVRMGFNREAVKSALSNTGCRGVDAALDWLTSHAGKCILTLYFSIIQVNASNITHTEILRFSNRSLCLVNYFHLLKPRKIIMIITKAETSIMLFSDSGQPRSPAKRSPESTGLDRPNSPAKLRRPSGEKSLPQQILAALDQG